MAQPQRMMRPTYRLVLVCVVVIGSLVVTIFAGNPSIGVASTSAVFGVGFGLNAWGLRDALLEELQARRVIGARSRTLVKLALGGVGFVLAIVAIVVFFTLPVGSRR
jgi:hypothetical protein